MKLSEAKKMLKGSAVIRRKAWDSNILGMIYKSFTKGEPKAYYIIQTFGRHKITSIYSLTDDDREGTDWEVYLLNDSSSTISKIK